MPRACVLGPGFRGGPSERAARRALGFALALAVAAIAENGRAAVEPPEPPSAYRLADDPKMFALTPWRHARGLRFHRRLARHRLGWWLRRTAHPLDWPPGTAEDDAAAVPPADGCVSRLTADRAGFPFVLGVLSAREPAGVVLGEASLSADEAVVPAWLQRFDARFAERLLSVLGCGRGGLCPLGSRFPPRLYAGLWKAQQRRERADCRQRPARILSHGGDQEVLFLLRCDGSVVPATADTLAILARPPGVPRPDARPLHPTADARPGEWMRGIHPIHPRLLWLLEQINREHPWKGIYIYSGYRPGGGAGGGESQHHHGRALDLRVQDVSNEELLAFCWTLPDVGCGYYPHHDFVHVDVRPLGTGRGLWVDASEPGARSEYLAEWPGVVENGRVVYEPEE